MKKARIITLLLSFSVLVSQSPLLSSAASTPAPTTSPLPSATPAIASASPSPAATASASPAAKDDNASPAPSASAAPEEAKNENVFPAPHAKAALLYDLNGGRSIYQSHADDKVYPASTTKIMTALLALEKGNLADTVTVSETALADIDYRHSKLGLKAGEQMTLENLLTALLVCSANDAANVIAEYISGDIPTFVELMNTRAKELGMVNTHFVNPHGFHDDNHYTTANDLMLVTREALKSTKFREIVKIKTTKLPATNMSKERTISSTNHLISRYRNTFHYYQYATGVKTGSTDEAGSCLVATAEKNGISLLSVVMGCENENQNEGAYSFVDTKAMFEYVFNNYKNVVIAQTSEIVSDSKVYEAKDNTRVALSPSKDISILLPSDYTAEEIAKQITLPDQISAPVEKGSQIGTVTYSFRGETIATVDLLAANEVKRDGLIHFLHVIGRIVFSPFVLIPLIAIVAFLLLNAMNQAKKRKIRRRRMKSQHMQQTMRRPQGRGTRSSSRTRSGYSQSRRPSAPHSGARRPSSSGTRSRSGYNTDRRGKSSSPRSTDPWDKYR